MASTRKSPSTEPTPAGPVAALLACLETYAQPTDQLTVGLSGGIDSVVLLHALAALRPAATLSAVHVHHGLSPHADQWAEFCCDFAQRLGVACICTCVQVERGSADGLEAAARRARHGVFAQLDTDWIVLAHHRDDQAETLLFNLLRGTGLAGAAAMRPRRGKLLRPLLDIGRAEIEAYAVAHGLDWIEDESNRDTRHTRNFLRHRILAPLAQRFGAAAQNLAAAAARFAEAQELLNDLARLDLGGSEDFPVTVAAFQALPEPRARNALRFLLAQRGVRIPNEARLREALRQMLEAGIDRHPAVKLGTHRLVRRRGWILVEE